MLLTYNKAKCPHKLLQIVIETQLTNLQKNITFENPKMIFFFSFHSQPRKIIHYPLRVRQIQKQIQQTTNL